MPSINKATIMGHLGRDPEIRTTQNGTKIANFSVATSERWKNKQTSEYDERTQWHNVVVFNDRLVPLIEKRLQKGSLVYVEGQIETRKWQDQSGNDKYTTEIVLRYNGEIKFFDRSEPSTEKQESYQEPQPQESFDIDDEIPF
jgi:single-strand DNA-binding protein